MVFDPGRSARPGLVLLHLGPPGPGGCPTAGSLSAFPKVAGCKPVTKRRNRFQFAGKVVIQNVNQKDQWKVLEVATMPSPSSLKIT